MAVKLTKVATPQPKVAEKLPPFVPVNDPDTGAPLIAEVAGVKVAIVARSVDAPADEYQVARYRSAREASADYVPAVPAKDGKPAVPAKGRAPREAGWTTSSRVQDVARCIEGGLLA